MGEKGLTLKDGLLRETLASRSFADKSLKVEGDVGMSTGILMHAGSLEVLGNAGKNMGVLQSGGELIVRGDCDDFTATEMGGRRGIRKVRKTDTTCQNEDAEGR